MLISNVHWGLGYEKKQLDYELESSITHRNREQKIKSFKYKSTSRSKLYLNPLQNQTLRKRKEAAVSLTSAHCWATQYLQQNS